MQSRLQTYFLFTEIEFNRCVCFNLWQKQARYPWNGMRSLFLHIEDQNKHFVGFR